MEEAVLFLQNFISLIYRFILRSLLHYAIKKFSLYHYNPYCNLYVMNLRANMLVAFFAASVIPPLWAAQSDPYDWDKEIRTLARPDLLPRYRTGYVEEISSYDTTGGNDDGFSGRYSYIRKENGKLVLADLKGPGVINRIWTPTPTQDTISFYFDGETAPRISLPFADLFSGDKMPFVAPLCGNEIGGFYCYLPIPYEKSCKIVFSGERILFHQIQYRLLPDAEVTTFNPADIPIDALDFVRRSWLAGIAPRDTEEKRETFLLAPGDEVTIYKSNRPGRILGFEIDGGKDFEGLYKDVLLCARWDDDEIDAVHAPLQDFFGYAYGKPSMRSLLVGCSNGLHYCYLPCPYDRKAEIKLVYKLRNGVTQHPIRVSTKVYYNDQPRDVSTEGRFYTYWNREINMPQGKPYPFAKLKGRGHYVGTVHLAQGLIPGMTLFFEGDDSVCVDGVLRMHGTGSEDYYNGGWYAVLDRWDRGVSLPIHGSLDYSLPLARTGGYRWFLSDKISFEKEFYKTIEHGPDRNAYPVDYTSVAYYYGDQAPEYIKEPTDELRTVRSPDTFVYYPQLMDINLGRNLSVRFEGEYFRMEATSEFIGSVRINLPELSEGRYRIFLNYIKCPDGADFRIWQRQKPITGWLSSLAEQEHAHEKCFMGETYISPQTASLTIEIRARGKARKFDFGILTLECD